MHEATHAPAMAEPCGPHACSLVACKLGIRSVSTPQAAIAYYPTDLARLKSFELNIRHSQISGFCLRGQETEHIAGELRAADR